jgi:hypothetical protein
MAIPQLIIFLAPLIVELATRLSYHTSSDLPCDRLRRGPIGQKRGHCTSEKLMEGRLPCLVLFGGSHEPCLDAEGVNIRRKYTRLEVAYSHLFRESFAAMRDKQ